ncbi:MAG: permease-like cell division protein FtsX [Candidatus Wallbacteria bacterium]|nr:permease-like cell division protein FtsX [Candidatus Wallbacteria bacterium]
MKGFNKWQYYLREARSNMSYFSLLTLTSVSTVTVVLTILSLFLLLSENLKNLSVVLEREISISAFLDTAPRELYQEIIGKIRSWPDVTSANFLSKEVALVNLERELSLDSNKIMTEFGENPLPDILEIKPVSPEVIPRLVDKIRKEFPWLTEISYGKELVTKVESLSRTFRFFAALLVFLLGTASLFIIANTIKLTLFSRREEIEIMQLIGATRNFISTPFLMEGMIQGFLGAMISLAVSYAGYTMLVGKVKALLPFLPFLSVDGVFPLLSAKILVLGLLIGFCGSFFSIKKNFDY